MVQRIMNTVEKTSTGVSPAELVLNNSIRLTSAILTPPSIIHNLRPFNYDEERTDPVAVTQQNAQEFVFEEVLAHRGDRAKRSTLEFRIRWSGFGEESDSW